MKEFEPSMNKRSEKMRLCIMFSVCVLAAGMAQANTTDLNDTITAIYGAGNPNSGWVSSTMADGSTLALIADYRGTGVVPNNGDGSYTFPTGTAPANPNRAVWNFAFSVSDPLGITSKSWVSYELSITGPGGVNTSFLLSAILDNAYLTPSGIQTGTYADFATGATVMQNSENVKFAFLGGNPSLPGDYVISLKANNNAYRYVQNEADITVHVVAVPEGGLTAMLLGMGMLAVGWVRRMVK